jgi:hypothetical protein
MRHIYDDANKKDYELVDSLVFGHNKGTKARALEILVGK